MRLLLPAFLLVCSTFAQAKPNIVLIIADDLGWRDLSSFGSGYYRTPNIDRIVTEGRQFTNAYANPNCAPTRAALISGRYSPRTGIYTVGSGARGQDKFRKMVAAENETNLKTSEVTFGEALKAAGYTTAHMGKWHMGTGEFSPENQGFDVNIGGNATGSPRGGYFSPFKNPQLPDGPAGQYLTDRMGLEASRFITANQDQPFFLYFAPYAVHTPIQPRPDLLAKWQKRPTWMGQNNPSYASMVESLDAAVGRILNALDDLKLADNTVVFFYSDNGGLGGYRRAGVNSREVTDNAPLRGGKGMLYEGGVRVPLAVRYPGQIEAGTVSAEPIMCVDFYPTLLEIATAKGRPEHKLDGTSFWSLAVNDPKPASSRAPLYWHFPGYLEGRGELGVWRTTPGGAIRFGEFKLIEFFETGGLELYNLAEDIGEQKNLAKAMPGKTRDLHEQLKAWREATNAPMPLMK